MYGLHETFLDVAGPTVKWGRLDHDFACPEGPLPGAHDLAIGHDRGLEDPVAAWHDRVVVLGCQGSGSIPVAKQVLIEARKDVDASGWPGRGQGLRCEVVPDAIELEGRELRTADLEAAAHVSHGQAGPSGEVGDGGRAVTSEVPQGEFAERLVTFQPPRIRHPVVEQREGLLPAFSRPEDERAGLGEVPQEVVGTLTERLDAGLIEGCEKRVARQDPPTGQG